MADQRQGRRQFGERMYVLWGHYPTKAAAQAEANNRKRSGAPKLTRIVKAKGGYALFVTTEKKTILNKPPKRLTLAQRRDEREYHKGEKAAHRKYWKEER